MKQTDDSNGIPNADRPVIHTSASDKKMIARGRFIFAGIAVYYLLIGLPLPLLIGIDPEPIWIVMNGSLLIAAWLGHDWAVVFLGLILSVNIMMMIVPSLRSLQTFHPIPILISFVYLGGHIAILLSLIYSKSLKSYFIHKNNHRKASRCHKDYDVINPCKVPACPEKPTGKELFTVATFDHRSMADICRVTLEHEGIKVFLNDEHVIGEYNFFLSNALHGIKVQVSDLDAKRALQILADKTLVAENDQIDQNLPINFNCEECGRAVSFPGNRKGHVEVCPYCGRYVDVP